MLTLYKCSVSENTHAFSTAAQPTWKHTRLQTDLFPTTKIRTQVIHPWSDVIHVMDVSDRICAARGPKSFEIGGIDKEYEHADARLAVNFFNETSFWSSSSIVQSTRVTPVVSLVRHRQGANCLRPDLQLGKNAGLSCYNNQLQPLHYANVV